MSAFARSTRPIRGHGRWGGVELAGQRADDSAFPVEVSLSPLQDGSDPAGLVLATVHDITARRAAEERARQLLQELTSANEELSNFAYVVSHSLKAPLSGIAPRNRVESTGVGLALAKKIVEMYGGTVGVTSSPGTGAKFSFTLPKMEER